MEQERIHNLDLAIDCTCTFLSDKKNTSNSIQRSNNGIRWGAREGERKKERKSERCQGTVTNEPGNFARRRLSDVS